MIWLALGLTLSWFAGLKLRGPRRCVPKALAAADLHVSLIIPARNESENLRTLLPSIFGGSQRPAEVLVVDDASSDDTAAVATALGARVLPAAPLPGTGWTGKNWACHQGATAASGEVLFFLDADCQLEPDGYRDILAHFAQLNRTRATALSVVPWHRIVDAYENFSLFFTILMSSNARRLVGPSLVVRRADYERAGGHRGVREQVLENFFMTETLAATGTTPETRRGLGVLTVRMFPRGLHSLVEGWTKAFARGAQHSERDALLAAVLWLFGFGTVISAFLVTSLYLVPGAGPVLTVAYLSFAAQLAWLARRLGSFRWLAAAGFPVTWIFYQYVFLKSLCLSPTQKTWKGRTLS